MYYKKTKDIKQVQERLGHSQIQTTMNLYLHPSEEEIREDWKKAQSEFDISKKHERSDENETKKIHVIEQGFHEDLKNVLSTLPRKNNT